MAQLWLQTLSEAPKVNILVEPLHLWNMDFIVANESGFQRRNMRAQAFFLLRLFSSISSLLLEFTDLRVLDIKRVRRFFQKSPVTFARDTITTINFIATSKFAVPLTALLHYTSTSANCKLPGRDTHLWHVRNDPEFWQVTVRKLAEKSLYRLVQHSR